MWRRPGPQVNGVDPGAGGESGRDRPGEIDAKGREHGVSVADVERGLRLRLAAGRPVPGQPVRPAADPQGRQRDPQRLHRCDPFSADLDSPLPTWSIRRPCWPRPRGVPVRRGPHRRGLRPGPDPAAPLALAVICGATGPRPSTHHHRDTAPYPDTPPIDTCHARHADTPQRSKPDDSTSVPTRRMARVRTIAELLGEQTARLRTVDQASAPPGSGPQDPPIVDRRVIGARQQPVPGPLRTHRYARPPARTRWQVPWGVTPS